MTNKKKCLTEFELKTILARGSATEEETDIMREMFQERYGVAYFGMCLHPYWLLNDIQLDVEFPFEDEQERAEVDEWLERETLDLFDEPDYEKTNPPITILCGKPDDCHSRKKFGNACRCVRENFRNQADFREWQENKLTELKDKIIKLVE